MYRDARLVVLELKRTVAVGTALAGGPPHRSQRAELPHWAPASGPGSKAHFRVGMHYSDLRYPSSRVPVCPLPGDPIPLASAQGMAYQQDPRPQEHGKEVMR